MPLRLQRYRSSSFTLLLCLVVSLIITCLLLQGQGINALHHIGRLCRGQWSELVTGQNGSGQNGTDKMVWKKWYTDKMVLDKMARTKWYGQNDTNKILRIKLYHFVRTILSVPFCP